jgi:hypothetical protein
MLPELMPAPGDLVLLAGRQYVDWKAQNMAGDWRVDVEEVAGEGQDTHRAALLTAGVMTLA